jgi:hypothetical protein
LRFASDDVLELVKRALFAHWEYEHHRRTKRRQAQINQEPNKRGAGERQVPQAANPSAAACRRPRSQSQGASEHKNPLADAARKLSRAFAKAEALQLAKK